QYASRLSTHEVGIRIRRFGDRGSVGLAKEHAHRRADPWRAVEGQRATEFPDEAVDHRQPQPRPAAGLLRREERLLRTGTDFLGHAYAGVRDLDAHVIPGFQPGHLTI